jgi:hypothetical protein
MGAENASTVAREMEQQSTYLSGDISTLIKLVKGKGARLETEEQIASGQLRLTS